jgi:hypothetical protein
VAIGCYPDGVLPIHELEAPTPGFSNLNVGIEEMVEAVSVSIYPNPMHEDAFVQIQLGQAMSASIDWITLTGETLYHFTGTLPAGSSSMPFPHGWLAELADGIYLVRVKDAAHPAVVPQIIKVVNQ